jgi:two-component system nitrate/nitrite response regulator NarL
MTSFTASNRIRVLLIHRDPLIRAGLRLLIESQAGFVVIGEAQNGPDAVPLASREQPDIILLDLTCNTASHLDLLPALHTAAERARVLVLMGMDDPEVQQRAVRLGAMGVVLKDHSAAVLFKAIEKVHAGEAWIDRALLASLLTDLASGRASQASDPETAKIALLTVREREVIRLVGAGLKNKHIAERLCISETTVRHHLTSIFQKLGVEDRLALVIYAYRYGLAKVPG